MALFDNGKPESLLLFMCKFKMMLGALGMLISNVKLQYIRTLLRVEALSQFDTLCDQVGKTNMAHLN